MTKRDGNSSSKRLVVRACEHSSFVPPSVRQHHKQGNRKKAKNRYALRCSTPRDISFIPSFSCSSLTFSHQSFVLSHSHKVAYKCTPHSLTSDISATPLYSLSSKIHPRSLSPSSPQPYAGKSLFSAAPASPRFFVSPSPSFLFHLLSRFSLNEYLITKPFFLLSLLCTFFSFFFFLQETRIACSHQSNAPPFRTSLQHTPQLRATLLSNMFSGYKQVTQFRACGAAQYTRPNHFHSYAANENLNP